MISLTDIECQTIEPRTWTYEHFQFALRDTTIGTLHSELSSSSISINIIHLMLARRNKSAILPLQHALQQSQTLANIHSLE
jgi:hypothetical protein